MKILELPVVVKNPNPNPNPNPDTVLIDRKCTIDLTGEINNSKETYTLNIKLNDGYVPDYVIQEFNDILSETFSQELLKLKPKAEDYCTEIKFELDHLELKDLVNNIKNEFKKTQIDHIKFTNKMLELCQSQLRCAKGEIGTLEIIRKSSLEKVPGMYLVDLVFYADFEDELGYLVNDIETFIPLDKDKQAEWLKSLVGGNHEFTHKIAISCTNFNLDDISEEFNETIKNIR